MSIHGNVILNYLILVYQKWKIKILEQKNYEFSTLITINLQHFYYLFFLFFKLTTIASSLSKT